MKIQQVHSSFLLILTGLAGILGTESFAQVSVTPPPGINEALRSELSAQDIERLKQWEVKSEVQLRELLTDVSQLDLQEAKDTLVKRIKQISDKSGYRSELLMRYVLDRSLRIVEIIDKNSDIKQPGVLLEEVRALTESINFALEFHLYDVKSLSANQLGTGPLPYAEFGIRYAEFLMKLDRKIMSISAQYNIAYLAMGLFQWDLFRQSDFSFNPIITRIYDALNSLPKAAASDNGAEANFKTLADLKALTMVYQRVQLALQNMNIEIMKSLSPPSTYVELVPTIALVQDFGDQINEGEDEDNDAPTRNSAPRTHDSHNLVGVGGQVASETGQVGLTHTQKISMIVSATFQGFRTGPTDLRYFKISGEVTLDRDTDRGYSRAEFEVVPIRKEKLRKEYRDPVASVGTLKTTYLHDPALGFENLVTLRALSVSLENFPDWNGAVIDNEYGVAQAINPTDSKFPFFIRATLDALGSQIWNEIKDQEFSQSLDYIQGTLEGRLRVAPVEVIGTYSKDIGQKLIRQTAGAGILIKAPKGYQAMLQYTWSERHLVDGKDVKTPDIYSYRRFKITLQKSF